MIMLLKDVMQMRQNTLIRAKTRPTRVPEHNKTSTRKTCLTCTRNYLQLVCNIQPCRGLRFSWFESRFVQPGQVYSKIKY